MTHSTLEQRVTRLEEIVARLRNGTRRTKDWRRTIGMFAGDEVMKQIEEEGRKIREADRAQVRRRRMTK